MRFLLVFSLTAALSGGVLAQSDQDHAAHHPDGASAPAAGVTKATAKTPTGKSASAPASASTGMGMDMESMHGMHDQMHGKPAGESSAQGKSRSKSKAASAPASSPMGMDSMQQMHEQMHGKSTNGQMKSQPPGAAASADTTKP